MAVAHRLRPTSTARRLRGPARGTRTSGSGRPSSPHFEDTEEVALDPDTTAPARSSLAEDKDDRIARVDAVAGLDLVVVPGPSQSRKNRPDSLVTVVDARRGHPARRRVPDNLRIEVLARNVVSCRKAPGELLDDLHVLLRHCPRSISRRVGMPYLAASRHYARVEVAHWPLAGPARDRRGAAAPYSVTLRLEPHSAGISVCRCGPRSTRRPDPASGGNRRPAGMRSPPS